jgi:hypothetical protein
MAKAKRNRVRKPIESPRSRKAGRPVEPQAVPPRVRRRRTSATAAFRKDTTIHQAARGPRVVWGVTKPKVKKG